MLACVGAQGFSIATFRAETPQHVRLSATPDGRLTLMFHEGWEISSQPSHYQINGAEATSRFYASPAFEIAVNNVAYFAQPSYWASGKPMHKQS